MNTYSRIAAAESAPPFIGNIERLDLVELVFQMYPFGDLENISIVGAQHILPSTLTMLQSFFDRGVLPQNIFLIGKCYSTDFETYEKLRELGVYVCPSSLDFQKSSNFDDFYANNISGFVDYLHSNNRIEKNRLTVVLDDGGVLISRLNQEVDQNCFKMVGVEQTTSGFEKIKNLNLNLCVINVARSFVKLNVESGIVAKTAVDALITRLAQTKKRFENALIVGNGAIGSALASRLEGQVYVTLVDIDNEKSDIPYEKCFQQLNKYDLIIGCTGTQILDFKALKSLKKGTTLASLSSSDREFDVVKLRKEARGIVSCHDDFTKDGVTVLNCGFPVNFTGMSDLVDIEEFSLTRSLLALGILQAIEMGDKKGLLELSKKHQKKLLARFLETFQTQVVHLAK
ncbi:MAG: hypothetical protein HYX48_01765 [Chlamydiales bacterium]|nr:hypothetical protein [Chlamydiales bacterium]